jgi:polysaccharide pyruvyl transferase WcaK-like protein
VNAVNAVTHLATREDIAASDDLIGLGAATLGTAGFFALLIVLVWQIAATWRARMLAFREDEYRKLAAKYAELLEDNTEIMRRYTEEMAQTRQSLAAVERMLREID